MCGRRQRLGRHEMAPEATACWALVTPSTTGMARAAAARGRTAAQITLKNYNYYEVNSSEDRRDTRPTEYTWSEPKVRDPGADYKPGKFKHLDDAISKAKKKF